MFDFIFPEDVEFPRSVNAVERARLFDLKVPKYPPGRVWPIYKKGIDKKTLTSKFRAMRIQTVRPVKPLSTTSRLNSP